MTEYCGRGRFTRCCGCWTARAGGVRLADDLAALSENQLGKLPVPEHLLSHIAEARRITNFEGKRRQMQYVGKLMRKLEPAVVQAVRDALDEQRSGSAKEKLALHQAEQWRDRLIAQDEALEAWLKLDPDADLQHLRTLVRQARKDAVPAQEGEAPRHGKSFREIFQLVRAKLDGDAAAAQAAEDGAGDEADE